MSIYIKITLGTIGFLIFLIAIGSVLMETTNLKDIEIGKNLIKLGIAGIFIVSLFILLGHVNIIAAIIFSSIIAILFSFLFPVDRTIPLLFLAVIITTMLIIIVAKNSGYQGWIS